jgi:hypothetical protein
MQTKDFIEKLNEKLDLKDNKLSLKENKNIRGVGNIFYEGVEICPCPLEEIFEDYRENYTAVFPGDRYVPHPTQSIIEAKVIQFIDKWNNEEGFKDLMLGK